MRRLSKSTSWCPHIDKPVMDPLGLGIPRIQNPGIVLLSSPIGSFQFVETKVMEKIQAVRDIPIQLPLIKDPH